MKKIIISFVVYIILTIGTALAAPESLFERQSVQSSQIGIVDQRRIMTESSIVKAYQEELNQLGKELNAKLSAEKESLTPAEYQQKQEEVYGEFLRVKMAKEKEIDLIIHRSMEKVATEKNLTILVYKNSTNLGGLDVTEDIKNSMIVLNENQILNQSTQICTVGFVDVNKVMQESPMVKVFQDELNQKAKELNDGLLELEKDGLAPEELQKKKDEVYGEFAKAKQEMENKIATTLHKALEKVAKEKNLEVILYKNSVAYGGLDVTDDAINNIE